MQLASVREGNRRMRVEPGSKMILVTSIAWIVFSLIFLDTAWAKVADLRSAGQYLSPWRYGQVLFWIALLTFWICKSWTSFHQYRSSRKVS